MKRAAFSRREVIALLGISKNHVRKLEREGLFHAVRLGKRVLIPVSDLENLGLLPLTNQKREGCDV
ncbi:MAG: helix-turn-helix domain-containing protein [Bacillota bacterium]